MALIQPGNRADDFERNGPAQTLSAHGDLLSRQDSVIRQFTAPIGGNKAVSRNSSAMFLLDYGVGRSGLSRHVQDGVSPLAAVLRGSGMKPGRNLQPAATTRLRPPSLA